MAQPPAAAAGAALPQDEALDGEEDAHVEANSANNSDVDDAVEADALEDDDSDSEDSRVLEIAA